jgi:hypothetical protein
MPPVESPATHSPADGHEIAVSGAPVITTVRRVQAAAAVVGSLVVRTSPRCVAAQNPIEGHEIELIPPAGAPKFKTKGTTCVLVQFAGSLTGRVDVRTLPASSPAAQKSAVGHEIAVRLVRPRPRLNSLQAARRFAGSVAASTLSTWSTATQLFVEPHDTLTLSSGSDGGPRRVTLQRRDPPVGCVVTAIASWLAATHSLTEGQEIAASTPITEVNVQAGRGAAG